MDLILPTMARPIPPYCVIHLPQWPHTEELFHQLSHQSSFPPEQVHVFFGDMNAHTGNEQEDHISPHDNIPTRLGDHHHPTPPLADTSGATSGGRINSAQRGRLMLRLGATDSKSIIDYFSIAKHHYHKVSRCTILPTKITFHSNRPKTPEIKEAFRNALETLIIRDSPKIHRLTNALKGKTIPIQTYADKVEKLLTGAIQFAAHEHLQRARQNRTQQRPPPEPTPRHPADEA
jgi:hypothetical protein